ncbi:hypothetical protein HYDPIDRAFT_46350, partial [Hydnomerulius pinastri MD-312]
VSTNWARKFRTRHPDLRARWTTSLEACHAQQLNPTLVKEFFKLLSSVIKDYNILPENIYNMDEKGVQLGVGKRTYVLVDRDQKTVHQIEEGSRELVTIIECVCADGTALAPAVIYKAKRRNLEWGRDNPSNAYISFSPKGWTDMELGLKWLETVFEPETAARNLSNGWRLLILDGHNSHCSYSFCIFADKHRIIVICLIPHSTHRLQPCDVGVFGPLASSWKSEVNLASRQYIKITKTNFLQYYHNARSQAFKEETIRAAFRKTGIWPVDPSVIEESAFAPSLNTTTQASQPVPATIPDIVIS